MTTHTIQFGGSSSLNPIIRLSNNKTNGSNMTAADNIDELSDGSMYQFITNEDSSSTNSLKIDRKKPGNSDIVNVLTFSGGLLDDHDRNTTTFNTDILPSIDQTYNIGSSTQQFATIYLLFINLLTNKIT